MPTVKLRFTGLCGFVPKKAQYQSQNQVRVLMVEAGPTTGGSHVHHEEHVPVLVCPTASVDSSGNGPNGEPLRKGDLETATQSIFFLTAQDVSIDGAALNALTMKHGGGGVSCHTAANVNNCEWLAEIATISGGQGKVRTSCLTTTDPVAPQVVARCSLTMGELRTEDLAKFAEENRVVRWEFKRLDPTNPDPLPTHTQALSEVMLYEVTLPGTSVDLRTSLMPGRSPNSDILARLFQQGNRVRHIRLRDSGQGVVAAIGNLPLSDLFGLRPRRPPGSRDVDHHFECFYRLLVNPASLRVPWPLAQDCGGGAGPSYGNPQCPGAKYDSDGGA